MAITPGDFTDGALLNVKTEVSKIFKQNQINSHLEKPLPVFKSLAEGQSIELAGEATQIIDGKTCNVIQAIWMSNNDTDVLDDSDLADDATDCEIDGTEGGADTKTYQPNTKFHRDGKVVVGECRDMFDFANKFGRSMELDMMVMDLELEKRMIAFLLANVMTLDAASTIDTTTFADTLEVTNTVWNIPTANWNNQLIAKFKVFADRKQFFNPKLISGANLYEEQFLAMYKDGDSTDYSPLVRPGSPIPLVNNLLDLEAITGEQSTFIVDNANIGYFNTYKWTPQMTDTKDQFNTRLFTVNSNRLRWRNGNSIVPVKYDVKMQYKCIGEDQWAWVYRMKHNGALITGPAGAGGDQSGIAHVVRDWTA